VRELPGGEIVRRFRIQKDRPRWLFTHLARYGDQAEVLAPPEVRRGMAQFLDSILAHALPMPQDLSGRPGGSSRATAAAAARPPPMRARARRRPAR
jgi:hypothetical protein